MKEIELYISGRTGDKQLLLRSTLLLSLLVNTNEHGYPFQAFARKHVLHTALSDHGCKLHRIFSFDHSCSLHFDWNALSSVENSRRKKLTLQIIKIIKIIE